MPKIKIIKGIKSLFRSRTIRTIAGTVAGIAGIKIGGLDAVNIDNILELLLNLSAEEIIGLVGAVVAIFYRKFAKVDMSKPVPD